MKKKEVKKVGYKRIIKNNESHQKVYNDLETSIPANNITIAKELSSIPSKTVIENFKTLRISYLILISIFLILRILGIYQLTQNYSTNNTVLVIAFLFGILVPAMGIYGILAHKLEHCKSVSIFLILSFIRVLGKIELSPETLIGLGLTIALIVLGFIAKAKMVTPFKKTIVYIDGNKRNVSFKIEFELTNQVLSDDILDDIK